ncbi:hypothetical protein AB1E19_005000 [Capra hircus]
MSGAARSCTALSTGSKEVVGYLLEPAPTEILDAVEENGETCLHQAAALDQRTICQYIVEAGASLVKTDQQSDTPRQRAEKAQDTELAAYLENLQHYQMIQREDQETAPHPSARSLGTGISGLDSLGTEAPKCHAGDQRVAFLDYHARAEPQRRRSVLAGFQQQVPMILSRFHLPPPGFSDPAGTCLQAARLGLCARSLACSLPPGPLRCNVTLQGAAASCWEPKESIHIPIRGIRIPSCEIQNPCAAKERKHHYD